jgi:hypothetical protein
MNKSKINQKRITLSLLFILLSFSMLFACNPISSKNETVINENTKLNEQQKAHIDSISGKYKLFIVQINMGVAENTDANLVIDSKDLQVRVAISNTIIDTFSINGNLFTSKYVTGKFVKENGTLGFRTGDDSNLHSVFSNNSFYTKDITCDNNATTKILDVLYAERGDVYSFWSNLQSFVKTAEKQKVSTFFSFPFADNRTDITVNNPQKSLAAQNNTIFINKVYDKIFTTENINLILNNKPIKDYVFDARNGFYFNLKIDGNPAKLSLTKENSNYKISGFTYLGF